MFCLGDGVSSAELHCTVVKISSLTGTLHMGCYKPREESPPRVKIREFRFPFVEHTGKGKMYRFDVSFLPF